MHTPYLTKSDYKIARTCPAKLYYHKLGYPTREEGSEHLSALADQGYLVEALARALYTEGRWIGYQDNVEAAAWETMTSLADNPCTLFEATFISGGRMARVDILVRRDDTLELIEIKSCGFDRQQHDESIQGGGAGVFRTTRGQDIRAEWRPYVEDAAFQCDILRDLFPHMDVVPYLLMPDTSRASAIDSLHHHFTLRTLHGGSENAGLPAAEYTGDPRELRRSLFLARVEVRQEVEMVLPEVRRQAQHYLGGLLPTLRRLEQAVSVRQCCHCEYRVAGGEPDANEPHGFRDCWGDLADASPHLLDLYHAGSLDAGKRPLGAELIAGRRAALIDIPEQRLTKSDSATTGEIARRQQIQVRQTRAGREWQSAELAAELATWVYPLHFVDFETCAPAVPRYRGMRPFETIAFQWCCQTVSMPDNTPTHSEWLQTADAFPNFAFAGALRRQLGDEGTVLVWGSHEASVLRAIRRQMLARGEADSEICGWIERFLDSGRLVDMNRLTLRHYFHPHMAGRTSLKIVADVVWRADATIRARLPQYGLETADGLAGPYAALPPLVVDGRAVSVADGMAAILAYYAMLERAAAGATLEADRWRHLLRQYCQLDTRAMVMVWWRWRALTANESRS